MLAVRPGSLVARARPWPVIWVRPVADLLAGLPQPMRTVLVQEAVRLLAALPEGKAKAAGERLRPLYLL